MCDITAELTAIKNEFENIKWQAGLCQEAIAIKNELENIKWHHDLCKEALDIKKELDRIKQEYDRLASQKPSEVKKEEPKKEEPKKEEPKKVEVKKEEPKKDEPKKEEPKKVEVKKEEPKKEEPKKEEPKKNMSPESAAIEAKLVAFKEGKLGSKDLNLNNSRAHFILPDFADLLCEGLRADTKEVETLQLSNCCLSTEAAKKIVEAVCANTTIHVLALETNKIGADGITFIGEALKTNTTIRELKLANQLQKAGTIAERAFVEALKSNTTLVKCSFPIFDSSARNSLERILMHNANLARRAKTAAAAPAKPAAAPAAKPATTTAPKPAAAPAPKPTTTAAPKPAATSAAPAAKPTTPAAPAGGDGKVYSYEELLKKPAGLDRTKLESYLSDEEFAKVFGMDKEAFYKLAKWKQGDKKKAAKLY